MDRVENYNDAVLPPQGIYCNCVRIFPQICTILKLFRIDHNTYKPPSKKKKEKRFAQYREKINHSKKNTFPRGYVLIFCTVYKCPLGISRSRCQLRLGYLNSTGHLLYVRLSSLSRWVGVAFHIYIDI